MTDGSTSCSELILYQTEDGRTRIDCRFEGETIWLTQAQMAKLFQTTPQNITLHLRDIFAEGELTEEATCKEHLQVRQEGQRQVARSLRHYNLDAILAVGYRVRSHRGTQFRQWATARLREYLVKGFTMDDERLKNPPGSASRSSPTQESTSVGIEPAGPDAPARVDASSCLRQLRRHGIGWLGGPFFHSLQWSMMCWVTAWPAI